MRILVGIEMFCHFFAQSILRNYEHKKKADQRSAFQNYY